MGKIRHFIIACLLLALIGGSLTPGHAQSPDGHFFTATRHWVRGDFWAFYQAAPDALLQFGYPITIEFTDDLSGYRVQYFQRARFDLVPTPNGLQVQVAPLGELLYDENENIPARVSINSAACSTFASTGKTVCLNFLDYYNDYNGALYLGDPISGLEELVDGRYVQYFRNGRLEWNFRRPEGQRLVITDLGRIYFERVVDNPAYTRPEKPGDAIISMPIELKAGASVEKILLRNNEVQTIYINVTDQFDQPVANAQLSTTITLPDGNHTAVYINPTDAKGNANFQFYYNRELPPNSMILVDITITAQGQKTTTQTWYRIWW